MKNEDYIYIIEYKYTANSHLRYQLFSNISDAFDYYIFLKRNINLEHLSLKKCSLKYEVYLCGR